MRRLGLKNRRGVFVVMFGILFLGLMGAAAISIDLTRTWSFRNELQTSADAAALAGAVQLSGVHHIGSHYEDSARAYARRNRVLHDTVTVDVIELGRWDVEASTFTVPVPTGETPNAIRAVVSHEVTGIWGRGLLGIVPYRIKARAIAWWDAGVTSTNCLRPWAIPYQALMSRVNTYRGIANDSAGLAREFTDEDRAALDTMPASERTFTLKLGSGTVSDYGDITTYPGSYQAVNLPKYWDSRTQQHNPDYTPGGGADAYREAVAGVTCHHLQVGDSLGTQTGNMVGPTVAGADANDGADLPGVCGMIVGNNPHDRTPKSDPTYGDCLDADGNSGVEIKAAFFLCGANCNGKSIVEINMLGSFTLTKLYPGGDTGSDPQWDAAEIRGVFHPMQDVGEVGGGSSTLRRIILVECQAGRSPCT